MQTFTIATKKTKEVIDISDRIERLLQKEDILEGFCKLFLLHGTAALTTVYIDPTKELTLIEEFEMMVPRTVVAGEPPYDLGHMHYTMHVPNHVIAAFIGSSIIIPFRKKRLLLGRMQRTVLGSLKGLVGGEWYEKNQAEHKIEQIERGREEERCSYTSSDG